MQPGMTSKIRALLLHIEPDMRGKLEKKIVEMSMAAQQAAIENINSQSADGSHSTSEIRASSPHSAVSSPKFSFCLWLNFFQFTASQELLADVILWVTKFSKWKLYCLLLDQ